jgi:hypothetical protein
MLIKKFIACALGLLFICSNPALARELTAPKANTAEQKKAAVITIKFPVEHSVGQVFTMDKDWNTGAWPAPCNYLAEARGLVKLPADKVLVFNPNGRLIQHPEILSGPIVEKLEALLLNMNEIDDRLMEAVSHCVNLKRLELNETDLTDEQLKFVKPLAKMRGLSLAKTLITGPGLANCVGMKDLETLNVSGCSLKPGSLDWLPKMSKFNNINMTHCLASDRDVAILSQLPLLYWISLDLNNDVTDRGIVKLAALKNLRMLNLEDTSVTMKGVMALNMPGCQELKLPACCNNKRDLALLKKRFPAAIFAFREKQHRENMDLFK